MGGLVVAGGMSWQNSRTHLQIYLNDHLAGGTAGHELAKRMLSENRRTSFEPLLSKLVEEIGEDRRTLEDLIHHLQLPVRTWKTKAAWVAEKAARLKLNGSLWAYSPLSRLVEIEGLRLGVEGKASLWRTLLKLAERDPRFDAQDLRLLLKRAEQQVNQLEELRIEAAKLALAG
jgi:hypothetical protein